MWVYHYTSEYKYDLIKQDQIIRALVYQVYLNGEYQNEERLYFTTTDIAPALNNWGRIFQGYAIMVDFPDNMPFPLENDPAGRPNMYLYKHSLPLSRHKYRFIKFDGQQWVTD